MTVLDLMRSSFRAIGLLREGQQLNADHVTDALMVFNALLDACNTKRLNIYHVTRITFPLVVAKQTYTIGAGGDINTPRPPKIERAGFLKAGNGSSPIEMPMELLTTAGWAAEETKAVTSTLADKLYYEPANPLGNISIWPMPAATDSVALYCWAILPQVASAATVLEIPYGYLDFLRYRLAIKLAPEWSAASREDLQALALKAEAEIQELNAQFLDVPSQSAPPPPSGNPGNAPTPNGPVTKGDG